MAQCGRIQENKQSDSGHAQSDPGSRPNAVIARTHRGQKKQYKYVDTAGEAKPGAAALRPENGEKLNDKHKQVGTAGQHAGQTIVRGRILSVLGRVIGRGRG